ncbi:hypothetical protein FEM48_Zijuj11G0051900 [Ziziphus jujuba var. spinosa]|uniref:Coatomer subunit beta'-2-like n=1 Tax=Ziziphus jujuba var. spinosa TaxID=714518 RepID=A0A978UH11_ZIZJJ|nr:hypothetical protein FEM48_Zijuj11G0051900 [Ziziphus jujuba var. spinosa]
MHQDQWTVCSISDDNRRKVLISNCNLLKTDKFALLTCFAFGVLQTLSRKIEKEFVQDSERVKSVDFHPTEPWILASLYSGTVCIWDYQTKFRPAKFVASKNWIVAGADDKFIGAYNYDTMAKIVEFEARDDFIRSVAVHPTLPYLLSASDNKVVKLWDWGKDWICTQILEGHSHYMMQVSFNPKEMSTFATASLDGTIKTLECHVNNVTAVCVHPELPIIVTASEDGTIRIWHATAHRLENSLKFASEKVWGIGYMKGSNQKPKTSFLGNDQSRSKQLLLSYF